MFRFMLLAHRYLGIGIGLLVALWCLSAFVMMYVRYPDLTESERLATLSPLNLESCCVVSEWLALTLGSAESFSIEMLADRPILRIDPDSRNRVSFDLASGELLDNASASLAAEAAADYFRARGITAVPTLIAEIDRDQWTVPGYFDGFRPFYLFEAGADGSRVYVSSIDGTLHQDSDAPARFWNWFGAVVHWIYPTMLRKDTALWAQVVIWTTIVSLFLVVFGIYLGVVQFRRGRQWSPYRGAGLWHHYSGLAFGVLTTTWLLSGLFSMNPWGLFESDSGNRERTTIRGEWFDEARAVAFLNALTRASLTEGVVRIESAPLAGDLAVVTIDREGRQTRYDPLNWEPARLQDRVWADLPRIMGETVLASELLTEHDAYYFSHHEIAPLPVYRIVTPESRYYFDTTGGQLVSKVDANARRYRWWFEALHRFDFAESIRARPIWDIIVLTLLAGVTLGALTGVWMGYRRLTQ